MYKYSAKQLDFMKAVLNKELGFVNILEGSVRSGKTFISNLAWILFMLRSPGDTFLMSGESTDSLYRNTIADIIEILGQDRARYNESAKGGAQLIITINNKRKICYCRGGSKTNDEGKIRGITTFGWYADEITLHHKTFVKQALSRMSGEGARAIWTTNPDSPYHFIKKEYIDKVKENEYKHWHFTLDDNFSLNEEYKKNIKKAYTGVFYQRFILGLWVLAEGIIYDMFSKEKHIVETVDRNYTEYYVSIDYGTQNATVFILWGKYNNEWYAIKCYYYSGRNNQIQKTDDQYYKDLENFLENIIPKYIVIDPSAASFIALINQKGKYKVLPARNDVLPGIMKTGRALNEGILKFNDCCEEIFDEFSTYIWDEKAVLRGEDKPLKENDHTMDAIRYMVSTVILIDGNNSYNEKIYEKGTKPLRERGKGGVIF